MAQSMAKGSGCLDMSSVKQFVLQCTRGGMAGPAYNFLRLSFCIFAGERKAGPLGEIIRLRK